MSLIKGRALVIWILIFNLLDALITDRGISLGVVRESNPLAWKLYSTQVLLFYGWKMFLPFLLCILYPYIQKSHGFIR